MTEKIRVLYVDDEQYLLDLGKVFLERSGNFIVTTSTGAPEALRLLELKGFDAIVSDYQMPEMDGIEFLKVVRSRGDKTPFIIFTGKGREEVVIEALNSGADFYLQKGGEPKAQFAELAHKIKRAVEHQSDERALYEGEVRFRALIENASDIIRILDREGRITFDTAASGRELGYPPGYTLGRHPSEFIHPDDLAVVKQELSEVYAKTNTGVPTEFRIRKADGSYVWVESVGKNLIGVPGVDGIVITTRFIDERKRAEEALHESEGKFRQLFSKMPSGVAIYEAVDEGEDFVFRDFNATAEAIEHVKKEEVIGRRVTEVFPSVNKFGIFSVFKRVWRTGKPEYFPSAIYRDARDPGTWRENWVYRLQTGEIVAIYNDVTERKVAEQALIESQIQLAEAMDLAHIVNWEFDVASGIFTFNDRFYALYGTTAEREGGYQMSAEVYTREFVHPDDAGVVANDDPNYTRQIEHRIVRRDGEVRHIIVRFSITKDAEGRTVKTHGANQDITDRKQTELEIQTLLANVSHERERLASLINSMSDEVWFSDTKGQFTLANPTARQEFCLDGANETNVETLATSLEVLRPDGTPRPVEEAPPLRALAGEVVRFQEEIVRTPATGELRYRQVSAAPVHDDKGTIIGSISVVRDITDLKKAEDALKESEEKYRTLFNNMMEGFAYCRMIYDREGHPEDFIYLNVNPAFDRITNTKTITMKRVTEVYPGIREAFPELFEIYGRVSLTGVSESFEVYFKPIEKWLFISVYSPAKEYFVAVFDDITERKRMDAELQHATVFLKSIIDSIQDGISVLDTDCNIILVNKAMETWYAHAMPLIGKKCYDAYYGANQPCNPCPTLESLKTGEPNHLIVPQGGAGGAVVGWQDLFVFPIRDGKTGKVTGVIEYVRDISEQKKAEDALRESEEKFRYISELIPDFAYSCTKTSGGGFTIDWITGTPEPITGYTSDEIRKMTCWKFLVIDEDIPVFEKNVTGLLPGEFARCELRIRRKDGGIIWLSSYTHCVTDLKEPGNHRLYGACRDITRRKRAEEALRQANKRLNLLSSITRHDILNQL
ncbi:MAG: PAS domain S-box protein, partial [Methanoregula sp.]|nr:PAS domain S-box protein [Methanoregula sp.]